MASTNNSLPGNLESMKKKNLQALLKLLDLPVRVDCTFTDVFRAEETIEGLAVQSGQKGLHAVHNSDEKYKQ